MGIDKIVTKELLRLGIPRHLVGFKYLNYAICICITDSRQLQAMTKGLYPSIALKFETKAPRVERAMRHAIEYGWPIADPEAIDEFFGSSVRKNGKKPTNSQFIASVADEIRLRIQND